MDVFALQRALIDRYNSVVTRDLFDEVDSLFPEAEKGEAVSFDGTRLHYITLGEGLPLVICNGVWCTYAYHHYMAEYFRDRCRLILWDYRGHSRSQVPEDPCSFTMENFARDAAAVLDSAGVDKAVLLGFSMGVMTILEFWRLYPERTLGLIPLNGPYRSSLALFSESGWFHRLASRVAGGLSEHTWLLSWFTPIVTLPINYPIAKRVEIHPCLCPRHEMDLYFQNVVRNDLASGLRAIRMMIEYDASDFVGDIDVPTLVIGGTEDGWTPEYLMRELHEAIRGSEFFLVKQGTHATPIEQPDVINLRVDLWLRDHFREALGRQKSRGKGTAAARKAGSGLRVV
jgi:pimeloyl-ACP methyl ester carboxylesterase